MRRWIGVCCWLLALGVGAVTVWVAELIAGTLFTVLHIASTPLALAAGCGLLAALLFSVLFGMFAVTVLGGAGIGLWAGPSCVGHPPVPPAGQARSNGTLAARRRYEAFEAEIAKRGEGWGR